MPLEEAAAGMPVAPTERDGTGTEADAPVRMVKKTRDKGREPVKDKGRSRRSSREKAWGAGKPEWTTMMGLGGRRRADLPAKRVVAVQGPSETEKRRLRQRALERRRKEERWQQQAERTVQEKIDEEARRARERLERCKQEAKVRSEQRQKIKERMQKFVPPPDTSAQRRTDIPLHLKYILEYEQRAQHEEEKKLKEYREGAGKARNMGFREILNTHMGAENRRDLKSSPRGGWARGAGPSQGARSSGSDLSLPDIHRRSQRSSMDGPASPAWRSPKSSRFSLQPSGRTPREGLAAGGGGSALSGRPKGAGARMETSESSSGNGGASSGGMLSKQSHDSDAPSPSGSQHSYSASAPSAAPGGLTPKPPVHLQAIGAQAGSLSGDTNAGDDSLSRVTHVDRATSPGTSPWAQDRATSPILFADTVPGSLTKLLNAKKNGHGVSNGDTNDNVNFGTLMLSNSVEASTDTFLDISTLSGRNPESSTELPNLNGTGQTVESLEETTEAPVGAPRGETGGDKELMEEEQAATIIQARFRGHQTRRALKPSVFELDAKN